MTPTPYEYAFAALDAKTGPTAANRWLHQPNDVFGGVSAATYLKNGGDLVLVLGAIDAYEPKGKDVRSKRTEGNKAVGASGVAGAVATLIMFMVPELRALPAEQAVPITAAITTIAGWLGRYLPSPRGRALYGALLCALFLGGCQAMATGDPLNTGPDTAKMINAQCNSAAGAFRVLTVMKAAGRLSAQAVRDIDAAGVIINSICGRLERPTGMEYLTALQGALLQLALAQAEATKS